MTKKFTLILKTCLRVPSPCSFIILPMVKDHLMDRLSLEPILSINLYLTVTVTETGTETVRVNGPQGLIQSEAQAAAADDDILTLHVNNS